MKFFRGRKIGSGESGQILPMFAVFLIVMILFVALAIDLGYAYVSKANLSKAVDAAALKGMLSLGQGQAGAIAVHQKCFRRELPILRPRHRHTCPERDFHYRP